MPYTNPWSDSDPPGSQAANTADDEFRQLRLDLHERMNDLVEDWTDDPVVLKVASGIFQSKRVSYQDALVGGSKASAFADIQAIMFVFFSGVTGSNGQILLNVNEINVVAGVTWNVANNLMAISAWNGGRLDGVPVFMRTISSSGVANTFTMEFRHGDGAIVGSESIAGSMILTAQVNPT
jgi:hypothetical protein